jgi:ElaA protein
VTYLRSDAKLSWQWFNYSELSVKDLHDLLAIRQLVFIVEQASIYLDADAFDVNAQHLCVRDVFGESSEPIIAYARLIPPKIKAQEVILGRILVEKSHRGDGLGSRLVEHCIDQCNSLFPSFNIRLSAQCHLVNYYSKFGFETIGKCYDDGGIMHIDMIFKR